jgi:putative membrane protein
MSEITPTAGGTAAPEAPVPPIRSAFERFVVRLGFHPHATQALAGASSNALAAERTTLALERSYLAAERTLMAWIRTALSMISFGFTLGKIGQALQHDQVRGMLGQKSFSISNIAYFLVIIGTVALVGAIIQHTLRVHALYNLGFPRQFSIAFSAATLLAFVGGFALTALVLEL